MTPRVVTLAPADVPGLSPPSTLSATDIERIAVAVADEIDRRAHSPLRVTAADVRRWLP